MQPRIALASLLVTVLFCTAPALAASGVSLRWDNCYADGGVANKTFACDTNVGSQRMVLSLALDSPMADLSGAEVRMIIVSVGATVPAWWQMRNVGTCRPASLSMNFAPPPGSVDCVDWASGNASGGIGAYTIGSQPGLNSVVVLLATAVPSFALATLAAGQEYFAANLVINHAKTVGTGACAGCNEPVCIVLDYVRLATPVVANDRKLMDPVFSPDGNFARWQNSQETNVQVVNCEGAHFGCYHSFSCALSTTPTRNSTWGAVKSLYR